MPRITLTNGKTFEAAENETIVDAAIRAGLVLPYSCSTGRCGVCSAKVLSGETISANSELGLSDEQKAEGQVLLCSRIALSDLSIAIADLDDYSLPKPRVIPAKIDKLERLCETVMGVTIRLPPNSKFEYLAGQYINVTRRGIGVRSYSVANAVRGDGKLELFVSYYRGGLMSEYWFNRAIPGDLLQISGPHGTFFLRDSGKTNVVLLATGSGIAPIRAMLQTLSHSADGGDLAGVCLYWGQRTEEDLFWTSDEIKSSFKSSVCLSRPSGSWQGARGYVQDTLLSSGVDMTDAIVYACGNPEMIRAARQSLTKNGLPFEDFHSDSFVASDLLT